MRLSLLLTPLSSTLFVQPRLATYSIANSTLLPLVGSVSFVYHLHFTFPSTVRFHLRINPDRWPAFILCFLWKIHELHIVPICILCNIKQNPRSQYGNLGSMPRVSIFLFILHFYHNKREYIYIYTPPKTNSPRSEWPASEDAPKQYLSKCIYK